LYLVQGAQKFFREAVAEIIVLWIGADVGEGKYRD
jgi:hypothetical protein